MPRLSVSDLIALILTVTVAITVVLTTLALVVTRLFNPEADLSNAADAIGRIVGTLVAALVGYMAGRAPTRRS